MKNKSKEIGLKKILLGATLAVVIVGMSFGLGWYAKELSVIKQNQLKLQGTIEDVQSNTREISSKITVIEQNQLKFQDVIKDIQNDSREVTGKIAAIEQEQLKLEEAIEGVENNMEELIGSIAETIEQNRLKFQDVVVNVQKTNQELIANIAVLEKSQLEMQDLIEQISKRVLPHDSLEVISVQPTFPTALKAGEKLRIKIRYCVSSTDLARIWARPYTDGQSTPGYRAHGSPCHEKGTGEIEGYFFFDKPTIVDEIRVKMVDCETKKTVDTTSYRIDARWIGSKASKKESAHQQPGFRKDRPERISIDVDNPDGKAGWKDKYVVELKPTSDIPMEFGVDWFRPHRVASISTNKPDFINTLPKFRHEMQRYLTLRLGDAENNQIAGMIDFRKPDRKHFPFDLYLDRDRDGNLAEDFIEDRRHIERISIPYKDGTTENYALHLYSYSTEREPIGVAYQCLAGRYGILEADKKRIQILVIDNSGNGIFNDDDDVILLDWDLDGKIDGSHQADEDVPLYSLLKLPGASYRVVEFDVPGRRMVLRRQKSGWLKLW